MKPRFREALNEIWPSDYIRSLKSWSLEAIDAESSADESSQDEPIFVFATGFRSGSTLLQRLINSDPNVLMFGEPFEHKFLWHSLANSVSRFDGHDDDAEYLQPGTGSGPLDVASIADSCATLTPGLKYVKRAHLAFVNTLFKELSVSYQRDRWGAKLVRSDGNVAKYLRWLFPRCSIVFLYRDPLEAYRSFKPIAGSTGWPLTPYRSIRTPREFALHWAYLAHEFSRLASRLDAIQIRYEQIGDPSVVSKLEKRLNITIDRSVLDVRSNATKDKPDLTEEEVSEIREIAGDVMREVDY